MNYRVLAIYLITALSFGAAAPGTWPSRSTPTSSARAAGEIGLLFSTFTITAALLSLPSGLAG